MLFVLFLLGHAGILCAQTVSGSHFSLPEAGQGAASIMKMIDAYALLMDATNNQLQEDKFHFVRFSPDGSRIEQSRTFRNPNRYEFVSGMDINSRKELVVSTFSDVDFGPAENENPLLMKVDGDLNLQWCRLVVQEFDFHGFLSHKVKFVSDDRIVTCFRSKNEDPGSFFSDILLALWDGEGRILKSISLSIIPEEENLGIQDLEVDADGNIYLVTGLTLNKPGHHIPATRIYKFSPGLDPVWVKQTEGLSTFDIKLIDGNRFLTVGLAFELNVNRRVSGCYTGLMLPDGRFEWQRQVDLDINWPRNPPAEHLQRVGEDSVLVIIPNRDADEQYLLWFDLGGELKGAYWIPAGITAIDNASSRPSGQPLVYGYGDPTFVALETDGSCRFNLACASAEPLSRPTDSLPPAVLEPGLLTSIDLPLTEINSPFRLEPEPCRQQLMPSADFTLPEPVVCAFDPVPLDPSAYFPKGRSSWTIENQADTLTGKFASLPLALEPGQYQLTHILEVGRCRFTASAPLEVLPSIRVELGEAEHTLCPGESLLLQPQIDPPPVALQWQDGSTAPEQTVSGQGTYWIEVANELGCTHRDSIQVTQLEIPRIRLDGPPNGCIGQAVTLRAVAEGATEPVQWNTGATGDSLIALQDGLYRAEVANACGEASAERLLTFEWCRERIYIPTAFSPNGDGQNDFFEVFPEQMEILSMQVFNRWGEMVYREESGTPRWDGTYRGRPAPTGPYLYAIGYRNRRTGEEGMRSGEVVLMR